MAAQAELGGQYMSSGGPALPPDAARAEIDRLERQLDEALHVFAGFEEKLNAELRGATPEQRAEIFSRRAVYEQTLGIEVLLERIDLLKSTIRRGG